jgi:hypothetical protein
LEVLEILILHTVYRQASILFALLFPYSLRVTAIIMSIVCAIKMYTRSVLILGF